MSGYFWQLILADLVFLGLAACLGIWFRRWLRAADDEVDQRLAELDAHGARLARLVDEVQNLYRRLGSGDLSIGRVVARLFPNRQRRKVQGPAPQRDRRGIRIQGLNDLMITFGKCCGPIPGDPVIGLITRGRGISVHRTDCPNIVALTSDSERLTAVEWGPQEEQSYTVHLRCQSHDRKYLLSDISKAISDTGANIRRSSTQAHSSLATQHFWIDVHDTSQLRDILQHIRQVQGVMDVRRVDEPSDAAEAVDGGQTAAPDQRQTAH